jgi:hypothetical protein
MGANGMMRRPAIERTPPLSHLLPSSVLLQFLAADTRSAVAEAMQRRQAGTCINGRHATLVARCVL